MKKELLRRKLGIKKDGRMQLSSHGTGIYSVQIIRKGKIHEDIDIPPEVLKEVRSKYGSISIGTIERAELA